ncbi:MAG: spore coat associated protein CotJA [Clostridia bacterium]|nr:spore coat associated protein CotJA [Clostridia bacterium]
MVDAKSAPVEEEIPACILPDQEAPAPDCTPLPGGLPLAMVYSPKQPFENLYEPMEGLSRGTLFSALDLPFQGRSVTRR